MNTQLIQKYIDSQSTKAVEEFDIETKKIRYSKNIKQNETISEIHGDEEIVRAYLLAKLVNDFGYKLENIELERTYDIGRPKVNKPQNDVLVKYPNSEDIFLYMELKSPDEYEKDQAEIIEKQLYNLVAGEIVKGRKVKYLVLYSINADGDHISDKCKIIDFEKYPTFKSYEENNFFATDLPKEYGIVRKTPYVKGSKKDLETSFTANMLDALQTDLHNTLWGGGGTDDNEIFSSLTNLILAKIHDESSTEENEQYKFQYKTFEENEIQQYESLETLFERINNLYQDALKERLNVVDETKLKKSYVVDTNKFSLQKLQYVVQKLEGLSFVDGKNSLSGKDILGDFFEGIIRTGFKQTKGQFFTHINIVRFMLWAIKADELAISTVNEHNDLPFMIDPSCGSGTFLIEYMKFITQNIHHRFRKLLKTNQYVKDKIVEWFPEYKENKWAREYIYGTELNFNLGTSVKVNMILHGDGAANIFVKDGLSPFPEYVKDSGVNELDKNQADKNYNDKSVNGRFDLILTNPPFSVELSKENKDNLKNLFLFGDKKNSENLFIERYYQLLKPNGRMAVVLPESVFDTTENKYIRLFLYKYFKIKAVVSLPQVSFAPYTNTKTSILFAQKKTETEIAKWNELWAKYKKEYSDLKTRCSNILSVSKGEKEKDKLPSIKDMSETDERNCLVRFLKDYINEDDNELTLTELCKKYENEISALCQHDKDTQEVFDFVNTWWVFEEVSKDLRYKIFMAEAENVGYKRTSRGERVQPNDLYDIEYAPNEISVVKVNEDYEAREKELDEKIKNTEEKIKNEKKADKKQKLENSLEKLRTEKESLTEELTKVLDILEKYYQNDKLKDEYYDRTESELVDMFKTGALQKYASTQMLLRKSKKVTILDYARQIEWD